MSRGSVAVAALTEGLEAYLAAEDALSDFLQNDVATNEAVAELLEGNDEPTDEEIAAELGTALTNAEDNVDTVLQNLTGVSYSDGDFDGSGVSERMQAAIIADAQDTLESAVADAQEAVNEIRGLSGRIDTLVSREAQLYAAAETAAKADVNLQAEVAKFNIANGLGSGSDAVTIVYGSDGSGGFDRSNFSLVDTNTSAGVYLEVKDGKVVVGDAGEGEGIAALQAAGQALYAAMVGGDTALENFETALERVAELEAEGLDGVAYTATSASAMYTAALDTETNVWAYNPTATPAAKDASIAIAGGLDAATSISQALYAAKAELQQFEAAVASFEELKGLSENEEELQADVDNALDALEEAGYFVTIVDDSVDGTIEDDVFLYVENTDADNLEITNFSDEGSDVLYVGDAFAQLTALESDADLSAERLGSNDVREIFVQQDGNNTVLFIEAEAAAGGDRNLDEITTITLAGVNADDLVLENGFITIA